MVFLFQKGLKHCNTISDIALLSCIRLVLVYVCLEKVLKNTPKASFFRQSSYASRALRCIISHIQNLLFSRTFHHNVLFLIASKQAVLFATFFVFSLKMFYNFHNTTYFRQMRSLKKMFSIFGQILCQPMSSVGWDNKNSTGDNSHFLSCVPGKHLFRIRVKKLQFLQ